MTWLETIGLWFIVCGASALVMGTVANYVGPYTAAAVMQLAGCLGWVLFLSDRISERRLEGRGR